MKANALILLVFIFFSCARDESIPALTPYEIVIPVRFPPIPVIHNNPLTEEGVELGRMLFYDPILDKDNARSCATCHQQKFAFSSPDHEKHGLSVSIMPHFNFAWDNAFLWEGKIEGTLEDIMLFEIMEFFQTDLEQINKHEKYPELFRQVFNVTKIDYPDIARALAQFEKTLISADSKFDKYLKKEVELSEQEFRGYNLFFSEDGDCFHCHGTVLFKDNLFHNNGLYDNFNEHNYGRYNVTGDENDKGKFRTPSLRNIALTAPYMHDGRYSTLHEVLNFYSDHVNFTEYTDPLMNHEGGINLTDEQKEDVIAFLKTLTDSTFINNPRFSNPFLE